MSDPSPLDAVREALKFYERGCDDAGAKARAALSSLGSGKGERVWWCYTSDLVFRRIDEEWTEPRADGACAYCGSTACGWRWLLPEEGERG